MLQPEDEKDVQVTYEDQSSINLFSKLTNKYELLEAEYQTLKIEKEYLEELSDELELADEEEKFPYKIGDTFIELKLEDAQQRIQDELSVIKSKVEDFKSQLDSYSEQMSKLKATLYTKFGNTIHLEKD